MSGSWIAETVVGSAITWAVFTACAAAWAKWKLLPLWREHKARQQQILDALGHDSETEKYS